MSSELNTDKILIAFDGSENALRSVAYVAAMIGLRPDCQVDVVAIERPPDRDLYPDDTTWKEHCAVKATALRQSLATARDMRGLLLFRSIEQIRPTCAPSRGWNAFFALLSKTNDPGEPGSLERHVEIF